MMYLQIINEFAVQQDRFHLVLGYIKTCILTWLLDKMTLDASHVTSDLLQTAGNPASLFDFQ
jgi:hypothetical protein